MSPMHYIHIRNYSAPEIYVKCDDILRVMRRKSVSSQKINKSLWKHATYLSNELQEGQTRRLDWRAAQRQKEKPISKTRGRHEDTEKVRLRSRSGAEQWAGCSRSGLRRPGNKPQPTSSLPLSSRMRERSVRPSREELLKVQEVESITVFIDLWWMPIAWMDFLLQCLGP